MFTWWKQRKLKRALIRELRYRPSLESLERRELPAVSLNASPVVNISSALGNQRTQAIAVNPRNANQIVAFSNSEGQPGLFEAFSLDGGVTWNQQTLFNDPSPDTAFGDPQLAWDNFGNLFVTYVTITAVNNVVVALSTDGGVSFRQFFTTTDVGFYEQPSIAVGPGPRPGLGSVWISYNALNTTLSPIDHIETQSAVVVAYGIVGPFTPQIMVPGSDAVTGHFGDIAVGPRGEVMVTYQPATVAASAIDDGPSILYVNVDPDGMGPRQFGPRRVAASINVGAFRGPGVRSAILFPAQNNAFGVRAEVNLAWDRSHGPRRGRVYLVYTDAPTAGDLDLDTNVFLRFSDNRGLTWSAPVRVNDDTGGASQFNPAVAVDQSTGNVAVAWYDARNDAGTNRLTQFFAAVSDDGGRTFSRNLQVSEGQMDSQLTDIPVVVRRLGFGDYNKIAFVNGNLQLVWADNSPALPINPDPTHTDLATARIRIGKTFAVKVLFPARFTLIDPLNSVYQGRLTIISTGSLRGPFTLTIVVPDPSITFLTPANTQVGRTVTFTINSNLTKNVPLRFLVQLSNPLSLPLPTSLVGFASSIT